MYQDSYSYQLALVRVRVDNSAYRGRVFACHNIFDEFFTHVEYESINTEFIGNVNDGLTRGWVLGFLAGGGITRGISGRAGANLTVLFKLNN